MELEGRLTCLHHPEAPAVQQCDVCGDYLCEQCFGERAGQFLCPECLLREARVPFVWQATVGQTLWRTSRCLTSVSECPHCGGEHHYEVLVRPRRSIATLVRGLGDLRIPWWGVLPGISLLYLFGAVLFPAYVVARQFTKGRKKLLATLTCPETGASFPHTDVFMVTKNAPPGTMIAVREHSITPDDRVGLHDGICRTGHMESQVIGSCAECGEPVCRFCARERGGEIFCQWCYYATPPATGGS